MKKSILKLSNLALLVAVLCLNNACKDPLDAPLQFAVTIADASLEQVNDTTYRAPLGSSVQFLFEGNPDFISLQYNNFNEADATLSFGQLVNMQPNQNNMKLYLSHEKVRLSKKDLKADSTLIQDHDWTDISSLVQWPVQKGDSTSTTIDMKAYRGDSIILAFCYDTRTTGTKQPMFTISNLAFTYRTIKDNKVFKTLPASTIGWQPFDMLQPDDSLAYASTNPDEKAMGVWDVSFKNEDKTAFLIRQGVVGKEVNEDWLISNPVYIPRGKDDAVQKVAIKNYYLAVEDYLFSFSEVGEYTLTFIATNANYKQTERATRTFKFIVYE